MASPTSDPDRPRATLAEFGQDVARRRAVAGVVAAPRNAGGRRTESKTALLAAIVDAGGRW